MKSVLERELDSLLDEPVETARQRERNEFDRLAGGSGRPLVLFGAGGLGRRTLKGLASLGIVPAAFADNNRSAWGTRIDGVDVVSPEDAARRFGAEGVFVVTIWRAGGPHRFDLTQAQLKELGCLRVVPAMQLFWKHPEVFLDYYCLGLPHRIIEQRSNVLAAFRHLADERSRYEYVAQLRWRLRADFAGLPHPVPEEQYFPDDLFRLGDDECFVDCGAFDGDSIDAFVNRKGAKFRSVVALEPDPVNFAKLTARVAGYSDAVRARVRLEQLGASDFQGSVRFDGDGSLSSAANPDGSIEIRCARLDDLLADTVPTYLKMDIEGAEPEALAGASGSIRRHRPRLAISAYHRQDHLWRIPLQILDLDAGYRLYLRPHNEEGWDTVCYALPG